MTNPPFFLISGIIELQIWKTLVRFICIVCSHLPKSISTRGPLNAQPALFINTDFDRTSMLSSSEVSDTILYMAQKPESQLIEDLTLMPSGGAF